LTTSGSFAGLFAMIVSPQIRVYNRIIAYIAFFAFAAVVVALQYIQRRWFANRSALFYAVSALLMTAGVWDLTPAAPLPASFLAIKTETDNDRAFIGRIESAVPHDSMIFQLPYESFPESAPNHKMMSYDHLRGYVYSDNLRWSYAAMRGRPADAWLQETSELPVPELLNKLAAAGFQGIYVDSYGYTDGASELRSQLLQVLASSPIESADHRFSFYPLSGYTSRIKASGAPLNTSAALDLPLSVVWRGCAPSGGSNYWCPYDGELDVVNSGSGARPMHISARFAPATADPATLTLSGLVSEKLRMNLQGVPYSADLVLAPGHNVIKLHSDGKRLTGTLDPRTLVFAILDFKTSEGPPNPVTLNVKSCSLGSGDNNYWCPYDGELELVNSSKQEHSITLRGIFGSATLTPALLTLGGLAPKRVLAGNQTLAGNRVLIGNPGTPMATDVVVPPGRHSIQLHCEGKRLEAPNDPRTLIFSILNLTMEGKQ
jgi:phosphoglycerol transferase